MRTIISSLAIGVAGLFLGTAFMGSADAAHNAPATCCAAKVVCTCNCGGVKEACTCTADCCPCDNAGCAEGCCSGQ